MEVESFTDGTILKLCSEPNAIVTVGSVIAVVGEAGEDVPDLSASSVMQSVETAITVPAETGIKATLLVRNLARKRNINLQDVTGTGPRGLITRTDLENFEKQAIKTEDKIDQPAPRENREILLSRNQSVVAQNLAKSHAEIPQYFLKTTIYTDTLLTWREQHTFPDGTKISVTALLIHALAKTLIKTVDLKQIQEIETDLKRLITRARDGKLEHQDLLGGTFTITNLGMYTVDEFSALINPPQAGIIAVGQMEKRLHIDERNRMTIRTACTVTASFDHRIVNGALGAEFMSTLKQIIEEEIE
jgi:pyruvate dehydrogenase E2 component (dihydrolipoamide acetyltransferase)